LLQPWLHSTLGQMPGAVEWVLLQYRMPREPSTPRIAVWRRLRQLGVVQLSDGLVALPADATTREQLEWVAATVREAGGSAMAWIARALSASEELELITRMTTGVAAEYSELAAAAAAARRDGEGSRRRLATRLRRELTRIGRRDYFSAPERDAAVAAVAALGDVKESA
jgi:hypothetical protein